MTAGARLFVGLGLLMIPLVGYATFVEPFDLRLEEATLELPTARTASPPLRVAVLADLQAREVTDYEREAVSRLMATEPDLILVPGDIVHQTNFADYDAALPAFRELLGQLEAPAGVYFTQGNTDPRSRVEALLEGTGIVALRDGIVRFEYAGRRIAIGGLDLDHDRTAAGQRVVAELEAPGDEGELRILVAHRPDALWALHENSRIDLVVSGHTHGGQIQVPIFGPPVTLSSVPRSVAAGGLSNVDGRHIYVSRGVGLERGLAPRVRFLAPPEISLIHIL
jgi:predicted MPP superfamily phosphohydrolase